MWPFRTRAEPESNQEGGQAETVDSLLSAIVSNERMTKEQAMNVPALAGCVSLICDTVSTIPIRLYKIEEGRKTEVVGDLRVKLVNDDTGDTLTGVQFKKALVRDYLLGKGGYAYIHRMGNRILSLHYVKETDISFLYDPDPIFKDYDILVEGVSYHPYQFLKVLRNSENGWSGKSLVEENAEIISVAYHTLLYEKVLVKTGGNKKGFIKSENSLTDKAITALRNAWRRLYQNSTENVIVLNKGLDFKEASNTSVEMQLNENKKTNREEICDLLRVPMAMLSGAATEADHANFFQNCIHPILRELIGSLNRDLLAEKEKGTLFFDADTTELTKGDIEKRYRAYEVAAKNGFMQIDEIRYQENLPPLNLKFVRLGLQDVLYYPDKDEYYIPNMNMKSSTAEGKKKEGEKNEGGDT